MRNILRRRLSYYFHRLLIQILRRGEALAGPRALFPILLPYIIFDILRRLTDYHQFKRLRASLPPELQSRSKPFLHYMRMLIHWHGSLCIGLFYDRIDRPAWQSRFQVEGTRPEHHPEWPNRPVILVFIHVGGFPLLRYWFRSCRLPTAIFVQGIPPILDATADWIREAGNRHFGLAEVPDIFKGKRALRDMITFLQPGRVLAMALDGYPENTGLERYEWKNHPIYLKSGALRLASSAQAVVIPVTVSQPGFLRFKIRFEEPLPDHLLQDSKAATQETINRLLAAAAREPEEIAWSTMEAFSPELKKRRRHWP